jgi:hypothetical protein
LTTVFRSPATPATTAAAGSSSGPVTSVIFNPFELLSA